jgi:choline-sulfatase
MTEIADGAGESGTVSRRQVLKGVGVAGVAAAAMAAGVSPVGASTPEPSYVPNNFVPRGSLTSQPNFLVIIVDEQRLAPPYESSALSSWRAANLPAQNMLKSQGMDFLNHHIMATACAPSRTSFLTGQYPSLHGVTQTSGIAKSSLEQDLFWLDPTTVPTMGDWFRAGGYDTYYKGKWHVSDADLYTPGTHQPFPSFNSDGIRDPAKEEIYLEAGMLEGFGFTGWIGPEPHGSNPLDSGSSGPSGNGRDVMYAEQSVELMESLRTEVRPWLAVASFVNPHDICLWGELSLALGNLYLSQQLDGSDVPTDLFNDAAWALTRTDDLDSKPDAQAAYRETYPKAVQPTINDSDYQRFYYQLQKNVDAQIKTVVDALAADELTYRDTIVIYFSDHGELLGAHGGLHQKWHVAYDEVLKVPFVVHNPDLFPSANSTDVLTSHVDLLPTMLGLAGLDQSVLIPLLAQTHTQVQALPGRDLSAFLLGLENESAIANEPQYFMTDDEPMRGVQQVGWNGRMYESPIQPCHLESVVANLPTGTLGQMERWKYTRYFDNPDFWSTPDSRDSVTIVDGVMQLPGAHKNAVTTLKTQALPDQIEIYNTSADPLELQNIASDNVLMTTPRIAGIVQQLQTLLGEQVALKRLQPTGQSTVSSSTSGMFRFGGGPDFSAVSNELQPDEAAAVPEFTG